MYFVKYANWFLGDTGARVLLLAYLILMGFFLYGNSPAVIHFLFFGTLAFELIVDPLSKKYRQGLHLLGLEIVEDLKELIEERSL